MKASIGLGQRRVRRVALRVAAVASLLGGTIVMFAPAAGGAYAQSSAGVTVDQAPVITSAGEATFQAGVANSFTVTVTGDPAPTISESGALPAGVTFSTGGVLSGTPLTGIGTWSIQFTATNSMGTATQTFTLTVGAPLYTPVGPVRVLDTRNGIGGNSGPVGAGQTISLQVAGAAGVPSSGVTAVVLNVTATGPTASSFVTVYPDGQARPNASNLNFTPGETIPNLVTVAVGGDGKVDFYNSAGSVNLIADLAGYYAVGSGSWFNSNGIDGAMRVLDTRASGPVGAGQTISLQVAGVAGVPSSGVAAVVLNVTATGPTASSFVTVYPDGQARPVASNLNFTAGETTPNLVTVPVGADGKVDFYNSDGNVNLIADVDAYYNSGPGIFGSYFVPAGPLRVLDTRNGTGVAAPGPLQPNSAIQLNAGLAGLPDGVSALVLNVTATDATASSFVTVYPVGQTGVLDTSNLNFTAGETIPNLVVVPVGAAGGIYLYNSAGTVDLVADLDGYFL